MGIDIITKSHNMRGASRLDNWKLIVHRCQLQEKASGLVVIKRGKIEAVIRVIDKMWPSEYLDDLDYKIRLIQFFIDAYYNHEQVVISY